MNAETSTCWIREVHDALARLARRPGLLLLILLVLNSVVRPYGNLMHDARLYGLLAVNRAEGGAYADDLFLRHGSQDQYSIFSPMASPIVQMIGIRPAFFLLYLAFNLLFFFAALRLALVLVPDPTAAVLSLFYLAAIPIPYSALQTLHVHETFLTPRSLAIPLVMLALESMLALRPKSAAILLALATLVHPLVSMGGVMVAVGYAAWNILPSRWLAIAAIAAALLACVVVSVPSIGSRIFGTMDAEWHSLVRTGTHFCFTDEWDRSDWIEISVAVAVLLWAILGYVTPLAVRRLLILIVLVSFAGIIGSVVATYSQYAVLMQVQPFRVLWLLQATKVLLGAWLILQAFESPSAWPKLFALLLLFHAMIGCSGFPEARSVLLAAPIVFFVGWNYSKIFGGREIWRLLAWSVFAAGFLVAIRQSSFIFANREVMLAQASMHLVFVCWLVALGPAVWLALTSILAWRLDRLHEKSPWPVFAFLGSFALALQGISFLQDALPGLRDHATRQAEDLAFVGSFLHDQHRSPERLPVVYQGLGCFEAAWFDWHSVGYYDSWQIAGQIFHRGTATEGGRRRQLVAKFEATMLRDKLSRLDQLGDVAPGLRKMGIDPNLPPATIDDLSRLCLEPGLDYIIVGDAFPGLYATTNGRVYVYDCMQVRNSLGLPEPRSSRRIAAK